MFLLGAFYGKSSPVGYNPWGCKESDTTEILTRGTSSVRTNKEYLWGDSNVFYISSSRGTSETTGNQVKRKGELARGALGAARQSAVSPSPVSHRL